MKLNRTINDLIELCPQIFKRGEKSAMRFGTFECGSGWYEIMNTWSLLVKLACEHHVKYETPKSKSYRFWHWVAQKVNRYQYSFVIKNPNYIDPFSEEGKKSDIRTPYYIPKGLSGSVYKVISDFVKKNQIKQYELHDEKVKNTKVVYCKPCIVKEKFGTLNIQGVEFDETPAYAPDKLYTKIHSYTSFAQVMSQTVCDTCGAEGCLCVKGGYYSTLCKTCADNADFKVLLFDAYSPANTLALFLS